MGEFIDNMDCYIFFTILIFIGFIYFAITLNSKCKTLMNYVIFYLCAVFILLVIMCLIILLFCLIN